MRNKKLGREVERTIIVMRGQGLDVAVIAAHLGLHQNVVRQVLATRLPPDPEPESEIEHDAKTRRRLRSQD